jgi:phosphoribosylaminoimidazole-succinocarboxamide synthase
MIYDRNDALLRAEISGLKLLRRGKVRDIFELGENLLFIATDRISAFDVVMPNGIPDKGRALTGMSLFWFKHMAWLQNHLVTADMNDIPQLAKFAKELSGRAIVVKKAAPLAVECIVRGYLIGSGWKDYQKSGSVCGIKLREGYRQAEKLDGPIFTPSTKAGQGLHDENISYEKTVEIIGAELVAKARDLSIKIYKNASDYAEKKGIIIADTKFEFGLLDGELILIDEVLTPDSSRFWPADKYKVSSNPPSLDKQFVRDYLETLDWDKTAPGPDLPDEIVFKTREKYLGAYKRLIGNELS